MRPYNIKPNRISSIWIDLDHILAIQDPYVPTRSENLTYFVDFPFFTVVLAFKNEPMMVYAESNSEEHLKSLYKAHEDLIQAWGGNELPKDFCERMAGLYALQTHIGAK